LIFTVHRYGGQWQDFVSWWWLTNSRALIGDTKAGTLIGTDRYGNKYYENMTEELPRKTIARKKHAMAALGNILTYRPFPA